FLPPFLIGVLMAGSVSAQEDTTPPVLLDFKISPTLIDTAGGDVRIDFCVTADDDFSGLDTVSVEAIDPKTSTEHGRRRFGYNLETTPVERCASDIVPRWTSYGEAWIQITLSDPRGNRRLVQYPLLPCTGVPQPVCQNLCALGFPCTIENKFLGA